MLKRILAYISLRREIDDFESIREAIENGVIFRGTNIWILMFAVIVASVGLNMNSTAVVIGAMLISPLMGPINGIGFSIATYNFPLFRLAAKNFSFAVIASLAASTLYFAVSPVYTAHSELLARTSPTIYDVIIALFGGLAGIMATSSKQKGNVIPGVAIATALMPPLCTAGYGLASGRFDYFFGAMYLFAINSVFIALASLVISRILKFPISARVAEDKKVRINRWVTVVIVVTMLPSLYFGYRLVKMEEFSMNAARFIRNVDLVEGNYLLKNEIDPKHRRITLVYAGNRLTDRERGIIGKRARDFSLDPGSLDIQQGLSLGALESKGREEDNLKSRAEINRLNKILHDMELRQDSLRNRAALGRSLLHEIAVFQPQITSCSVSEALVYDLESEGPAKKTLVTFTVKGSLSSGQRGKMKEWLAARLGENDLVIYYDR